MSGHANELKSFELVEVEALSCFLFFVTHYSAERLVI